MAESCFRNKCSGIDNPVPASKRVIVSRALHQLLGAGEAYEKHRGN